MKNKATIFLISLLVFGLAGCSGGGGGGTPANPPAECVGKNVKVAEKFNYQFWSTLAFPPTKVKPRTELSLNWKDVTRDFLGHPVDPAKDISMVSVLSWGLPLAELEEKLNADTLLQKDLTVVPLSINTNGTTAGISAGATSANLFQFTLNGEPITESGSVTREMVLGYFDADNYPPANTTYTVMAASGDVIGQGTRMIQSFLLDKDTSNTELKMTPAATQLKWNANIHALVPTGIPKGDAAITVDWTDSIKKNALGGTFDPTMILHVLVGHYTEDVGQLEKKFLDIELIATELYRGDVLVGTSIDLSTLTDKNNKTFPGIDNTGTWMLALQCGVCHNPAPWYLTLLEPMDGCS